MTFKNTLSGLALATSASLVTPAAAQVTFGGGFLGNFVSYTDSGSWGQFGFLYGLAAYEINGFRFGVGGEFSAFTTSSFPEVRYRDPNIYYVAGYKSISLTYGSAPGAGNLFPTRYFGYPNLTNTSDNTIRLDYNANGQKFAASVDIENAERFEVGYAGQIYGFDVRFGYENSSEKYGLIFGKDIDRWAYQIAAIYDSNSAPSSTFAGVSLFYDITDKFTVGGNVAVDLEGDLRSGLQVLYDTGPAQLNLRIVDDPGHSRIEFSILLPFGQSDKALMNTSLFASRGL